MATIPEALTLAVEHHKSGRLQAAEALYRQILQAEPNHADVIYLLGVIAHQVGKHELAIPYIQRAITLNGKIAELHNTLANVYLALRRLPEAVACLRRALEIAPNLADVHHNLGHALKDLGKLDEAAACYRRALELEPTFAEAHRHLGLIFKRQGKVEEAAACYRRALEFKPDFPEAHYNLGNALADQGRPDEAIGCFRRALELKPAFAEASNNLGNALKQQGKLEEALACFQRALELKPDSAEAHNNLGNAYKDLGRGEDAIASYRRALELKPDSAEAHANLGNACKDLGKLEAAVACFRRALELKPGFAEVQNKLGDALISQGKREEAVAAFRQALASKPDFPEAHYNLGVAFVAGGRLDDAVACFGRALELKPDFAEAHSNLAVALMDQAKLEEAAACCRRALALKPDYGVARTNLALLLLQLGQYEEGWREYEHRDACLDFPRPFSKPRWHGEKAKGRTILVHTEQGFGDALQFVRYVSKVRRRAGAERVILETPPKLARLFSQSSGWNAEIVSGLNTAETSLPPFDLHVPLLSLPLALDLVPPLPMSREYMHADEELRRAWRERLGAASGLRVGLVWAGSPTHNLDHRRSLRPEQLRPLLELPGIQFYSLQVAPQSSQAQSLLETGLIDHSAHIADFADTAAFLAELDLVISVDTAVAHLAGAMGRPVWTLLSFQAEWRWGVTSETTPWYPSMRLFRQPTIGDWNAVVQAVAAELPKARRPRQGRRSAPRAPRDP